MSSEPQTTEYHAQIGDLGALRILLLAIGALLAVTAPFAGGEYELDSLAILPNLVAPPCAVMVFFVFALDMPMTTLFRRGSVPPERSRYNFVLLTEGAMMLVLLGAWMPFFLPLLSR